MEDDYKSSKLMISKVKAICVDIVNELITIIQKLK